MSLDLLYNEEIRDYAKYRRFEGKPSLWTHQQIGHNPNCGDELVIFMDIKYPIINALRWEGEGCALSVASVSMMAEILKGKNIEEAKIILNDILEGLLQPDTSISDHYSPLNSLNAVKMRPARIKCALLAWRALEAILRSANNSLSRSSETLNE